MKKLLALLLALILTGCSSTNTTNEKVVEKTRESNKEVKVKTEEPVRTDIASYIEDGYQAVCDGYLESSQLLVKANQYVMTGQGGKIIKGEFPVEVTPEDLELMIEPNAESPEEWKIITKTFTKGGKTYCVYTSQEWIKLVEVPGEVLEVYESSLTEPYHLGDENITYYGGGTIFRTQVDGETYLAVPENMAAHAVYNGHCFESVEAEYSFEFKLLEDIEENIKFSN